MNEYKDLINILKNHEGFKPYAYKDTLGYLTIGYGRCIDEKIKRGISKEEAEFLLKNDVLHTESILNDFYFFKKLDKIRKDVIIELVFNLGLDGFLKFEKTIEFIKNKQLEMAGNELLNSIWAKQVKEKRANNISYRLKYGKYPA